MVFQGFFAKNGTFGNSEAWKVVARAAPHCSISFLLLGAYRMWVLPVSSQGVTCDPNPWEPACSSGAI